MAIKSNWDIYQPQITEINQQYSNRAFPACVSVYLLVPCTHHDFIQFYFISFQINKEMYGNSKQNNRNLHSMLFVTRTLLLYIFTYVGYMPHVLLGSATFVTKLIWIQTYSLHHITKQNVRSCAVWIKWKFRKYYAPDWRWNLLFSQTFNRHQHDVFLFFIMVLVLQSHSQFSNFHTIHKSPCLKYQTFYDSINEQFRGDQIFLPADRTDIYIYTRVNVGWTGWRRRKSILEIVK